MFDREKFVGALRAAIKPLVGKREPVERFSPEAIQEIAGRLMLGNNATKVSIDNLDLNTSAFQEHATTRAQSVGDLKDAKTPSGELVQKTLAESLANAAKKTDAEAVQNAIKDVLAPTPEFSQAKTDYAELMQELVKQAKEYDPSSIIDCAKLLADEGKEAIVKQQKEEANALKEKLQEPGFDAKLKNALNITDDQLEATKKSILDNLDASQKAERDKFEKATQESLKSLHTIVQNKWRERYLIADLYQNDAKTMQEAIELAAAANRRNDPNSKKETTITASADGIDISSVSLSQLQFIQRVSGEKIEQTKGADGQAVFSIKMGMRILNPNYYRHDEDKKDWMTLAQLVRASGSEGIQMDLKFNNEKIAMQRARDAYEACLKSGFPPDKIKINLTIGAKSLTFTHQGDKDGKNKAHQSFQEGLYANKGGEYQDAQKMSTRVREALDKIEPIASTAPAVMKRELMEAREAARHAPPELLADPGAAPLVI